MNVLRSFVFNILFLLWSFFCVLFFLPSLLLPRLYVVKVAKLWSDGNMWLCQAIMNIHFNIIGYENLPSTPVIVAAKHQSTWETVVFFSFLKNPTIILKRELLWIPLFGWYIKMLGMITVARSKGKSSEDLKQFLKDAEHAVHAGHQILIFPEGTRSQPGQPGTYRSGVGSLYSYLKIPVIPVAHNAGVCWPRRGFFKKSGVITLEFLDPIQPGLSRQDFMRTLEERIESRSTALLSQNTSNSKKWRKISVFGL